jgi:hypothetical protein
VATIGFSAADDVGAAMNEVSAYDWRALRAAKTSSDPIELLNVSA